MPSSVSSAWHAGHPRASSTARARVVGVEHGGMIGSTRGRGARATRGGTGGVVQGFQAQLAERLDANGARRVVDERAVERR